MTQEEKAKAYDRVSKEVKDFFEGKQKMYSDVSQTLEYLFPELAESEDEMVRKELIKHLKELSDWKEDEVIPVKNPSYYRQWASWLEKQGQVKESTISQHEIETCKENDDSLTSENERIRKEIINYFQCQSEEEPTRKEIHNKWIAWLENIPYTIDHEKREGFHLGYKAGLEKQNEQKPTNSYCKENCKGFQETGKCFADGECKAKREAEQKTNKISIWSEEDERMFNSYCAAVAAADYYTYDDKQEIEDWLKSLRPQNKWKPSDVQIECLSDAIEHYNSLGYPASKLKELLDDLKKLKEE